MEQITKQKEVWYFPETHYRPNIIPLNIGSRALIFCRRLSQISQLGLWRALTDSIPKTREGRDLIPCPLGESKFTFYYGSDVVNFHKCRVTKPVARIVRILPRPDPNRKEVKPGDRNWNPGWNDPTKKPKREQNSP